MISRRWITIGQVEPHYVIIGNCGYPYGVRIDWRGRKHSVWQTWEFRGWSSLIACITARLGKARLEPIAIASAIPKGKDRPPCYWNLRVLVRRSIKNRKSKIKN